MSKKYLVFDISNILHKTFFVHKTDDDITIAGLAHHSALMTLNKYFKDYKPDKVVMAFDRSSWRKTYTQSEECISKRLYKGNRRQKMTPKEREKYNIFLRHLNEFEMLVHDHSSIITLADSLLEADDLIAGFVHMYGTDNEIVIISADMDLIQLLEYKNVTLIDPATGNPRTLEQWNNDHEFFLFEKCVRGDIGDNVQSALPRCRSTRIKKAYEDPYELSNLMNETWKGVDGREFVVKDLFNENKMLVDLREQPDEIQHKIVKTIVKAMRNPGKYSMFHFLKFCGKYELKKITEQVDFFVPMLSK